MRRRVVVAAMALALVGAACESGAGASPDALACRAGAASAQLWSDVATDPDLRDDPEAADRLVLAVDEFVAALQDAEAPELVRVAEGLRPEISDGPQVAMWAGDADIEAANRWCSENGEPVPFPESTLG